MPFFLADGRAFWRAGVNGHTMERQFSGG